jgi:cysteine desulfurase
MAANRAYLDHNATSPLRPAARAAMAAVLEAGGNASSVHAEGRAARARIETARGQIAHALGATASCVTFTSGATEANALALSPVMEIGGEPRSFDVLLISSVEHPSVRSGGKFPADKIELIPVNGEGLVDIEALETTLAAHRKAGRRALVSVMAANNETGALQPLAGIALAVHEAGGMLHSDAVQIAGKLPFDLEASGADLISISSHKLGGPQGAGVLIVRSDGIRVPPLLRGGGQEGGRRAGTENVAAIAGFGAAIDEAESNLARETVRQRKLRDMTERGIREIAPDTVILSEAAERLPNTICFAARGVPAETGVIAFDLDGVALSAGAACSSGKVGPSETLKAMGVSPEIAKSAMRLSIGWDTNEDRISRFLEAWKRVYDKLGRDRRIRAA